MLEDKRGLALTAAGEEAVRAFDATVDAYLGFRLDTGERLKATFAADRDMPMAHALRAYFFMLMGTPALVPRAMKSAEAAESAGGTWRECMHGAAAQAWACGDTRRATDILEGILVEYPRDALALKLAHFHHFYQGETVAHRDSVARVLPAWNPQVPGYGYVLGMRAFGLEEVGDYAAAERAGREAVEIEPADTWAVHAVAHVMEMQGRHAEGIAWIDRNAALWEPVVHNFQNHVWWHKALFHIERDEHDAALALFDRRFGGEAISDDYLDIADATSLLMRFAFRSIDVGDRWEGLAEKAAGRIHDHLLPFADPHYMMALAVTGREGPADEMITSIDRYAAADETTAAGVMREVANPLSAAVAAWGRGEFGRVVDLMLPIRYAIQRIGGSHAQRDVFAQLLLAAALAAGRHALARALTAERIALKPWSTQAWRWRAQALDGCDDHAGARDARAQAAALVPARP